MKRLLFILLFFAITVQSATYHVPADYLTIQTAIDSASVNSDTILVAPGRYYENINYKGKNVVVASHYLISNDPQDILNTIIDGSQYTDVDSAATVVMLNNESFMAELVGLVITGGKGANVFGPREGGGINIDNADPTIRNNIIVGNDVLLNAGNLKGGGGINFTNSNSKMIGNIVMFNDALHYSGGVLIQGGSVEMSNNLVAHNNGGYFTGTWDGAGGIYIYNTTSPCILKNNIIADNFANNYGGIGAIIGGNANLKNNIIRGNISGNFGSQINLVSTLAANFPVSYSNVEGGYSGTSNINDDPIWNERYELMLPSTSIDGGETSLLAKDIEDPMNSGMALYPSQGTTDIDMGVYGGATPLMILPIATYVSQILMFDTPTEINYIEPDSLQPIVLTIPFKNEGFVSGRVDSVVSVSNGVMASEKNIKLLFEDTLQLNWTPLIFDDIVDTIKIYHDDQNLPSPHIIIMNYTPPNCCRIDRGNVNNDVLDEVDISDLVVLVDFIFTNGDSPVCLEEANVDGDIDGDIDISDLVYIVDFIFTGGQAPPSCQ